MKVTREMLQEWDNRLPSYTIPGGYPMYYVDQFDWVLCPHCADQEQHKVGLVYSINWEDPFLYCDNCGSRIESAYAEDEYEEAMSATVHEAGQKLETGDTVKNRVGNYTIIQSQVYIVDSQGIPVSSYWEVKVEDRFGRLFEVRILPTKQAAETIREIKTRNYTRDW